MRYRAIARVARAKRLHRRFKIFGDILSSCGVRSSENKPSPLSAVAVLRVAILSYPMLMLLAVMMLAVRYLYTAIYALSHCHIKRSATNMLR